MGVAYDIVTPITDKSMILLIISSEVSYIIYVFSGWRKNVTSPSQNIHQSKQP